MATGNNNSAQVGAIACWKYYRLVSIPSVFWLLQAKKEYMKSHQYTLKHPPLTLKFDGTHIGRSGPKARRQTSHCCPRTGATTHALGNVGGCGQSLSVVDSIDICNRFYFTSIPSLIMKTPPICVAKYLPSTLPHHILLWSCPVLGHRLCQPAEGAIGWAQYHTWPPDLFSSWKIPPCMLIVRRRYCYNNNAGGLPRTALMI